MFRAFIALALCLIFVGCEDVRSMRRSRDVEGLIRLLSDPDDHVRIKAVDALGYVGDSRAVGPLIKVLRDENPYVREHAARNLGCDYHSSLGCDVGEAVQPLLDVLDDEDHFVRVEAARSLGEHPLPVSREPLEKLAVRDPQWEVRQAAAFALGRLASEASRPVLEALLDDEEEQVVKEARESLRRVVVANRSHSEERPSSDDGEVEVIDVRLRRDEGRRADGGASTDGGS